MDELTLHHSLIKEIWKVLQYDGRKCMWGGLFMPKEQITITLGYLWAALNSDNTKITNDMLITLLKTMCKSAGIKCNNWNDSRFTRVFKA